MRIALWCLGLVMIAAPALEAETERLIDRGVEDVDPAARSLRKMDYGIDEQTSRSRLFDLSTDLRSPETIQGTGRTAEYRLEGPGFRAYLGRSDYLVREANKKYGLNHNTIDGGRRVVLIPADSFFSLTPDSGGFQEPARETFRPGQVDTRLRTRMGDAEYASGPLVRIEGYPLDPEAAMDAPSRILLEVFEPLSMEETPPGGW